MSALGDQLSGMESGDRREMHINGVGPFNVHYESEQAMGDNGYPAKGYTTGHFHVEDPSGRTSSFRHSPHGPTLMGAKGYAADRASDHIISRVRDANGGYLRKPTSGRDVHPMSGRQGMNSAKREAERELGMQPGEMD